MRKAYALVSQKHSGGPVTRDKMVEAMLHDPAVQALLGIPIGAAEPDSPPHSTVAAMEAAGGAQDEVSLDEVLRHFTDTTKQWERDNPVRPESS